MAEEEIFSAEKQRRTEKPRFAIHATKAGFTCSSFLKLTLTFSQMPQDITNISAAPVKSKLVNKDIQTFLTKSLNWQVVILSSQSEREKIQHSKPKEIITSGN